MSSEPAVEEKTVYRSEELESLLRLKYPAPGWVGLGEVRDSTGFDGAGREADFMAFGVWPSRGLQIIGFEIKSYRGDWIRELANPAKAESIARFCDEWYLVTGPNVAKLEEIPAAWGWYVAGPKGLQLEKAPKPEPPVDLRRAFLMSVIRNISRAYIPRSKVSEEAEIIAQKIAKDSAETRDYRLQRALKLERMVADFKAASGIDLEGESWREHEWTKEVGEVVKAVMSETLPYEIEKIAQVAQRAQDIMGEIVALPFFKARKKLMRKSR